jgi:hypothetical protein
MRGRTSFALIALVTLLPGARIASADWPHDPNTNLPLCTLLGDQAGASVCPDGLGGAFVAWHDARNSGSTGFDLYVAHLRRQGDVDPAWVANGVPVVTLTGDQLYPQLVADGSGGFFVAWQDHRSTKWEAFVQRYSATGTVSPGWPANGLRVDGNNLNDADQVRVTTDAAGGAYVAWTSHYSGTDLDPYLQHITGAGAVAAGWLAGGYDLDLGDLNQSQPAIAPDGSGGVLVAFHTNQLGDYDIHAARITSTRTTVWFVNASTLFGDDVSPQIVSDGQGGAIVAFGATNGGEQDIFATHILANGLVGADWQGASSGTLVLDTNNAPEYVASMIPDGSRGAYIAEYYSNINGTFGNVQHVGVDGRPVASWTPTTGFAVPGADGGIVCVSDSVGGVLVPSISLFGPSAESVQASRWTFSGGVNVGWTPPPVVSSVRHISRTNLAATTDGASGAILVWSDVRNGTDYDLYAQRIERFGQLGNPEPAIASVKDVKNDQGGFVRLSWNPSYLDSDPDFAVANYVIYRQVPASIAEAALRQGRAVIEDPATAPIAATSSTGIARPAPTRSHYRVTPSGAQVIYWEEIGEVAATAKPAYSYVAPTTGDSIGGSNPYTLFMVEATQYYAIPFWDSRADSGYSVDNLPPVAPAPFTATFSPPNGTFASWGANGESDLAGYRLYRGGGLNFTPSPANRIYQGTVPSYHDATNTAYIYKVCAYDIHGNEGGCTTAQPPGTTDVGIEIPRVLDLAPIEPNPANTGIANLRLALPHDGRVKLTIYDSQGRRVRTLIDAWLPAGVASTVWNGHGDSGDPLGSGIYFARLEAGGERKTRRFAWIE